MNNQHINLCIHAIIQSANYMAGTHCIKSCRCMARAARCNSASWNALLMGEVRENSQTNWSWLDGYSNSLNNDAPQLRWTEKHLSMHNMLWLHYCQPRTGIRGYSCHRVAETRKLKMPSSLTVIRLCHRGHRSLHHFLLMFFFFFNLPHLLKFRLLQMIYVISCHRNGHQNITDFY